jgi:signal transduction histidine kinase
MSCRRLKHLPALVATCLAPVLLGLTWSASGQATNPPAASTVELPPLTRVDEIRQLSAEQARQKYPVRLKGVVVDYNRRTFSDLFVHDGTASIFVGGTSNLHLQLHPGELVEVDGYTAAGNFSPVVTLSELRLLGRGELPPPMEVSREWMASGDAVGQWVRAHGIVRAADMKDERPFIELATDGGRLIVRLENYAGDGGERLVDAKVSVSGVLLPLFNRKRQLLSTRLSVPDISFLTIEKPVPDEPFAVAPRKINSLMQYVPNEARGHRVRVLGTVTLQLAGQSVFIKDETQGLWVKSRQTTRLVPGEQLEVLGFPAGGEYTPVLEDAVFRQVGVAPAPQPTPLTVAQAREGNFDADLVQLDAQLLECVTDPNELVLVLEERGVIFRAHLQRTAGGGEAAEFTPKSRLRLTGVCLVQLENQRWPQSFRLLLRSPADVIVLQAAPWWTLKRVLWVLGFVTLVLLGALAWVITLRRRVRAQMEIIRQKAQREAVTEERARLAREFHDTLQQELAGIGIQLDAAASSMAESPELARKTLDLARSMVRHSQSEARRSVWDMRASSLESGDLAQALTQVASQTRNGHPIRIEVSVLGTPCPLPGRVESHLLRIGQEATTNAVKHADASNIRVELCFEPASVRLRVRDDGRGFDADNATASKGGHFGLLGMRERAEKVGGELAIFSTHEQGTMVEVSVPVSPAGPENSPS